MKERYERLFEHTPNLYTKNLPIAIVAGALLKDTVQGNVLAQLKLRNIGSKTIVSCKVAVQAFENNMSEIEGVEEYSYLDLYATPGFDFGDKNPIFLPNPKTRSFKAVVTEIVFDDNSVIAETNNEWKAVGTLRSIDELISDTELVKQFQIELGNDCRYIPQKKDGLFICSCGAYSLESNERCCKCGRSYDELMRHLDVDKLRENYENRLNEEKAKQLKREESKKKGIKISILCLALVLLLSVAGLVAKQYLDKNSEYKKALALKENGNYEESKIIFEELDGWKDSEKQVRECDELIQEENYSHAVELLNNGEYSKAISAFEKLGSYKESDEHIKKAMYEVAKEKMTEEDYVGAIAILDELGDYEDSDNLRKKCDIEQAYQELSTLSIRDEDSIKRAEELISIIPDGYKDVKEASAVLEFYKPYIGEYKSESYSVKKSFRVIKNKKGKWVACFGSVGSLYAEFEMPEMFARDGNQSNNYAEIRVINTNRIEINEVRPKSTFNSVYTR